MKVEQIKDNGEEVRLRVSASAAEMSKAFTDGLDAFVVQYQMDQLEGESSLEKINNALGEEDGKAAVYNAYFPVVKLSHRTVCQRNYILTHHKVIYTVADKGKSERRYLP